MKHIMKQVFAAIALLGFSAAVAAGNEALVSPGEPHGVVRVDVERKAEHIYPVKVVEINGDLVSADDKVALWLKPGKHTLTVKGDPIRSVSAVPSVRVTRRTPSRSTWRRARSTTSAPR